MDFIQIILLNGIKITDVFTDPHLFQTGNRKIYLTCNVPAAAQFNNYLCSPAENGPLPGFTFS
jgi:hypothetical protein